MLISDWSSDVCSSDLAPRLIASREACMKTRLSLIIATVAMFSLPAQASAALAIGSQAPDFTTNGALAGKVFKLHLAEQLKKGPVVLYFFPAAFTPGCTIEIGRASCRDSGCKYVKISGVGGSL